MGCWGMGMAQTDEFCEVYDQFMDAYDEGKPVVEITREILKEYHREFPDDDGIMHDVYFALAKAEWMCCEQSAAVLEIVRQIIDSGANLEFYREFGAFESDLKIRKRNMDKFWSTLQTPRASPRKRRKPRNAAAEAKEGLVFWYRSKGLIYGGLVLEIFSNGSMLVALSESLVSEPKTVSEVLDSNAYTAAWFDALLPSNRVHQVGTVDVPGSYNGRAGMYRTAILHFCENCGTDSHWAHEKRTLTFEDRKMRDLLNSENVSVVFRNQERLNTLLQNNYRGVWISCR